MLPVRVAFVLCVVLLTTVASAGPPTICGALWWMPDQPQATPHDYESFLESQRAIGFDLVWVLGSEHLMKQAIQREAAGQSHDCLEMLLTAADAQSMRVIVDLPPCGWYGKAKAEDLVGQVEQHLAAFQKRYGQHRCLYGWYLNYEVNELPVGETKESAWWRDVWRQIAAACHQTRPGSKVTISPFFMLDAQRRRGFEYLTPTQYAAWWETTLRETKIDILMLQDSGAEHLSIFTLADREPFFAAMQAACRRGGAHFWVNVESMEADVASWDDFIAREQKKDVPWRLVPIENLAAKLELASRYGEEIINWGYFPTSRPRAWPLSRPRRSARRTPPIATTIASR